MTSTKSSKKRTSGTEKRPAKRKKIVSPAEYEAHAKAAAAGSEQTAHVGPGAKKSAKATQDATVTTGGATCERGGKGGKLSGLDAAAQVLADASKPLNTKEMVDRMLAKGIWKTAGRTPSATIYSALLRHIQKNGTNSRFRKVARGRFELVK